MRRILLTAVTAVALYPFNLLAAGPAQPQAIVRLYPDWSADPRAYVTLSVPVERFEVKADVVRSACTRSGLEGTPVDGEGLAEAIVAVVPADQQDPAVIDVLNGLTLAKFLKQGSLALRTGDSVQTPRQPYLFLDTLGQPLPNAEVEVLLSWTGYPPSVPAPQIWLADAQLDAESCLPPPGSILTVNQFMFRVLHPDCGLVPAMPQFESDDGSRRVFRVAALPRDKWCVFLDALGYPMAGVQVEIITSGSWEHGRMTFLDPVLLDMEGRLPPPAVFTTLSRCSFLVSDPNYGMALIEPYSMTQLSPHEPLSVCVAPLVASGTPADAGAIWGTVVDSEGTRISGAIIACRRILSLGGPLDAYWPWTAQPGKEAKVLTDDRGRFAMRLPFALEDGSLGVAVPRGAMYEVTVTPPAELGCRPYAGLLAAGQERVVRLEGTLLGPQKYAGILQFEDERGPMRDPEKISQVNLTIRVRRANLPPMTYSYRRGEWLERSELPFGLYEATVDWDGKHYTFRPLMVRAESPKVIVFRPATVKRFEAYYRGRVVHGINGSPIEDAIIIPSSATAHERDFADPSLDTERVKEPLARTDRLGRFKMTVPVGTRPGPGCFIALKRDYFAFRQPCRTEFPTDKDDRVVIPDMRLFPAGVVVFEPNVPDDCRGKRVTLELLPADERPAAWLKELVSPPDSDSPGGVIRRTDLALRGRQSLFVPASVPLALRVRLPDERYAPTLVEDVRVAQGGTLDLGRLDFAWAVQIVVRVTDSTGGPVEGIVVRSLVGKGGFPGPEAATDPDGVARLRLAADSEVRLVVSRDEPGTETATCAETTCRVPGPEEPGREFVLQLLAEPPEQAAEPQLVLPAPGKTEDK